MRNVAPPTRLSANQIGNDTSDNADEAVEDAGHDTSFEFKPNPGNIDCFLRPPCQTGRALEHFESRVQQTLRL